ncbi:type 2 phosphatidylinositol 4,5-bisphosphate 4-phosphatase isoform X2 [Cimex lectularius]|uniref:Phosphatidylinositol-4,5-bisphosphate 4-phosphatase n=1 Tax=Cimex lectularius TaxID=79782 RepID=A0A8I6RQN7_CIMLE|nr:type 2 phosphatidylinositol 4,5-bisphosphate 4-phosphatase isoform X2 [Cimex lectularius]
MSANSFVTLIYKVCTRRYDYDHEIELPPPYQALQGPSVTCRVCQMLIDVTGRVEQHVVKCNRCNEATPIRKPPAGKKYIRCPCNCLLICKSSAQRIACPRANCKRIVQLTQSPMTPPVPSIPGMCKVTCVHCLDTFLFNTLKNALARCPHCQKVSSVGPSFAMSRAKVFLVLSIVLLFLTSLIVYFTHSIAATGTVWVIIVYIFLYLAGLFFLSRSIYYYSIKVSIIAGPI